jgi:hypothetical protein
MTALIRRGHFLPMAPKYDSKAAPEQMRHPER